MRTAPSTVRTTLAPPQFELAVVALGLGEIRSTPVTDRPADCDNRPRITAFSVGAWSFRVISPSPSVRSRAFKVLGSSLGNKDKMLLTRMALSDMRALFRNWRDNL